jgi:carboxyl-terminal processing protease
MYFKILLLLFFVALAGCHDEADIPINTPEINFDIFWNDFDRNYSFFELKKIDWNEYYKTYRPKITPSTSSSELATVFSEIILSLKDAHASMTIDKNRIGYNYVGDHPRNMRVNVSNYLSAELKGGVIECGIIRNGVGYLYVPKLQGIESDFTIVESILTSWLDKNLKGIIIDIRGNTGGNEAFGKHIIKCFNDQERIFSRVKFRNGKNHTDFTDWTDRYTPIYNRKFFLDIPIMVLTNRVVASSAESFVMAMQTIPNVTIVGDTTGGTSGNPISRKLPNGWFYSVPRWIEATPDYKIYENIGLFPDVPVWLNEQDTKNGKDTIIEKALELIDN